MSVLLRALVVSVWLWLLPSKVRITQSSFLSSSVQQKINLELYITRLQDDHYAPRKDVCREGVCLARIKRDYHPYP